MAPRQPESSHGPSRHTVLIGEIKDMWEKMLWDIEEFSEIQRSYPGESERKPLVYAALDACVSAWSLEQWARREWKRLQRSTGNKCAIAEFEELVAQELPIQALCADVANTYKHARYGDCRIKEGELALRWDEGSEYNPPGLMLLRSEGIQYTLLHTDLCDLPCRWWGLLCKMRLVCGHQPTPEWQQQKLRRIFGDVHLQITMPNP